MNIFQLASNDQSVYYLGYIFGSVGNVLAPAGSGGALTIGIIGTMLKVLNITALTVGVLMVVYITVVGVLSTAHEGQFFGKDWSGLWVPIKTVMGIVALFPTGSGYSIIQIIIMWIVIQGVAAADTMWTTVLNYINYAGSPYATVSVPTTSLQQPMQSLFQGIVCQSTAAYHSDRKSGDNFLYYCNRERSGNICSSGASTTLSTSCTGSGNKCNYSMGPNGACGVLSYCNQVTECGGNPNDPNAGPNSLQCLTCKAQQTALQNIVTYFNNLANNLVSSDSTYLDFYGSGNVAPGGSFIQNFCSGNGIGTDACCFQSPASLLAAGGVKSCPNTATLPAPSKSDTDTNISTDAMQNLYWPYVVKPLVSSGNTSPDIMKIVKNLYADAVAGAFTTWLATQPTNLSGWQADAQTTGWLMAGAYYFNMAQMNHSNTETAMPLIAMSSNDPYASPDNPMHSYRNNYSAANDLLTAIASASSTQNSNFASATGGSSIGGMGSVLTSGSQDVASLFIGMVSGALPGTVATNSLANLQHLGTGLLYIADAIFITFLTVSFTLFSILGWSVLVVGSGPINPMTPAAVGAAMILLPIVLALVGFLYAAGALLAVYTPLIPYIIFTMGVIGWMIGVIEAMIAGPLIALGILSPGKGGHEILGKAEPALMGMFGLFLRPTLMIIGMIAAMMLSAAAVTMVNITFAGVVGQIAGWNLSPSLALFFLAAYIGLLLSVLNKCFSLIHIIPDRVLAWIGGQHAPGGGHGEAGEALKGAEAKTSAAGAGAASMAGGASKPISSGAQGRGQFMAREASKGANAAGQHKGSFKLEAGGQMVPNKPPPDTEGDDKKDDKKG